MFSVLGVYNFDVNHKAFVESFLYCIDFKINETKFGKNDPPVSTKIVVVNCLQLNPVPMTPLGPFSYMIPQLLVTID